MKTAQAVTSTPVGHVAEQIRIRPTLLLGFGKLGWQLSLTLRSRVVELFGSPEQFPPLGFAWVGSTLPAQPESPLLRFRSNEVLVARELAAVERFAAGLLRDAHSRVRDPLMTERMLQGPGLRELGVVPHVSFRDKTQVFLVAAAGDPWMLPLARILRGVFDSGALECTMFVVVPPALQDRESSFLSELETGLREESLGIDHCYLLRPGEGCLDSLAELVFSEVWEGEFGDHKRSARINLRQGYRRLFTFDDGQYRQTFWSGYSTLALANLSIAHEPVIQSGADRLAAEVLGSWLGPSPKNHEVAEFLRTHLLPTLPIFEDEIEKRQDILNATLRPGLEAEESDGIQVLTQWHKDTLQAFRSRLRTSEPGVLEALNENIREFEMRQLWQPGSPTDTTSPGALILQLRRQAERWRRHTSTLIHDSICGLVDQRGQGLRFARAVLTEITQVVQNSRQALEQRAERHNWAAYRATEQIQRLLAQLSRQARRGNWDGRRRLILEHLLDGYLAQHSGVRNPNGTLLNSLFRHACKQASVACGELLDELLGSVRGDGTRSGGLLERIDRLIARVEMEQGQLIEQLALSGEARLPPLHHPVEYYWHHYWPEPAQVALLLRRVLTSLSFNFRVLLEDPSRFALVRETVTQETRRHMAPFRHDFHILRFLYRECSREEREQLLRGWVRRAESQLMPRTAQASDGLALVGIPLGAGDDVAQRNEIETYAEALHQWLHREYPELLTYCRVPDGSRISLYQESRGFPLQWLQSLQGLENVPEVVPLGARAIQGLEEACELLIGGDLLGLLDTEDGLTLYVEQHGCFRTLHPLGTVPEAVSLLSHTPLLREWLLGKVRAEMNRWLAGNDPVVLARLAGRLEVWKRSRLEAPSTLLGQVQSQFCQRLSSRIQGSSGVRSLGIERFVELVEAQLSPTA